ncbi:MAG TPA: patatin-like phospholipase family protein, partial [Thermoanaerobaculia bacterium]
MPRPPVSYENCILNEADARSILRECGIEAPSLCAVLDRLVLGDDDLAVLLDSPALSACGRELIDEYEDFVELAEKRDPTWGRLELRRQIVDDAMGGSVRSLRDVRLDNVYKAVHALPDSNTRTAVCVSGGGIRSATFALGVLQGLASAGILKKFDYLSTVSGGGYIGSWLSSWVRRHPNGIRGVEEDLFHADTAVGDVVPARPTPASQQSRSKIDPEPTPIRHLRDYSNYLSPRLGLLSADSWTLASLYVRNLLLNLLVLVPILALALAMPRFFSWGLQHRTMLDAQTFAWIVAISVTVAFAYIGAARPLDATRRNGAKWLSTNQGYVLGVIVPLFIGACALALFWARAAREDVGLRHERMPWTQLGVAVVGMVFVPWLTYYGRVWILGAKVRAAGFMNTSASRRFVTSKIFFELFAVSVALLTAAGLFYLLAWKVFPDPVGSQLYLCLAVPSALLVFFVQASIFVGLSSRRNDDADREWWGRGGALLLMVAIGLCVFDLVSVFGPVALYYAPVLLASIGGLA